MAQSCAWCFTINNYTEEDVDDEGDVRFRMKTAENMLGEERT